MSDCGTDSSSKWKIETIAVHAGHAVDSATGAVSAPIHLSTTFERATDGSYASGYVYSRSKNPNRDALERALAAIEGGTEAAAFASGVGAAMAVFQALQPGDHIVMPADAYHGVTKLVRDVFLRWALDATFVDMSDLAELRRALRPETKLVWIETPSNPLVKITDIAAAAESTHAAGAICVCDNSWAPIIQRPLDLGVDLVVHSTTKYIGGHCDVTGGAVIAKKAAGLFERVREIQGTSGGVPSPFDCWLVLRGMRTLPWRMRAHSGNAEKIANFLAQHPSVERVHYPSLRSHHGHKIAMRQMSSSGGMLAFEVQGGRDAAMNAAGKTEIFIRATSLGGFESLIEHRASIAGEDPRTPQGLLRLSVGLEHPDDLIADLDQALG